MAKVKSFKAETGLSLQIKDVWYKFYCGIELELEPDDDVATVKKKAWDTVSVEVEKQMKEVIKG